MLLLHGHPQTLSTWLHVAPRLADLLHQDVAVAGVPGQLGARGAVAGEHHAPALHAGGQRLGRIVEHLVARMVAQRLAVEGVDGVDAVRVTAEGKLVLCLGHDNALDLKRLLRAHPGDSERLRQALIEALRLKPERHHFATDEQVQVVRFMSMTGG